MAEYKISYLDEAVGYLSVDEQGYYKYVPVPNISDETKRNLLYILFPWDKFVDWRYPFPYFFRE